MFFIGSDVLLTEEITTGTTSMTRYSLFATKTFFENLGGGGSPQEKKNAMTRSGIKKCGKKLARLNSVPVALQV